MAGLLLYQMPTFILLQESYLCSIIQRISVLMKQLLLLLYGTVIFMSSCTLTQDTKFYADKSSSIEISMRMDPSLSQKMNSASGDSKKIHGQSVDELPKGWVSFYDLAKQDTSKKIDMSNDTVRILMEKMYIKYLVENGTFVGFSMKAEKLMGKDLDRFNDEFAKLNPGKSSDSLKPKLASDPVSLWDGQTLTLKIGKEKKAEDSSDKKKSKSKDSNPDMLASLFKDANIVITYRYSFEKKIKKIQGKHDFFKKIDDHTVVYELDFKKLMEMSEKGKSLKKKDEEIIVKTE